MDEAGAFALLRERAEAGKRPVLGVVGGTFDPVHAGHLALGRALCDAVQADAVLFVPTGNPSFKQGRVHAAPADRLRMVELAVAGEPRFAASAIEVARPGVTYTVDTLAELRSRVPKGTRVVFAVGADALATLHFWCRADEMATLVDAVAYAPRAGDPAPGAAELVRLASMGFTLLELPPLVLADPGVSSTFVRARVAAQDPPAELARLVGERVAAYIEEHGLYRAPAGARFGEEVACHGQEES